jgi:nucleoside-diphosphate-sugar epimerase
MTILTGGGSFAHAYTKQFNAQIASIRQLGEKAFLDATKKASIVIHNAATTESSDLDLSLERNFDFTRFLVQNLQKQNPSVHLIFLSSMSILSSSDDKVYGEVIKMTPYAYSKYLAETYCLKSPLNRVSCVRFSTLFFKDPQKDGLSKLVNEAHSTGKITLINNGEAKRNFLPVEIAARYIEKISKLPVVGKQIFTLASPQSTSFGEVAKILQRLLPKLEVDNIVMSLSNPVLADFSSDSIDKLGQINFSLEKNIANYLKTLSVQS